MAHACSSTTRDLARIAVCAYRQHARRCDRALNARLALCRCAEISRRQEFSWNAVTACALSCAARDLARIAIRAYRQCIGRGDLSFTTSLAFEKRRQRFEIFPWQAVNARGQTSAACESSFIARRASNIDEGSRSGANRATLALKVRVAKLPRSARNAQQPIAVAGRTVRTVATERSSAL